MIFSSFPPWSSIEKSLTLNLERSKGTWTKKFLQINEARLGEPIPHPPSSSLRRQQPHCILHHTNLSLDMPVPYSSNQHFLYWKFFRGEFLWLANPEFNTFEINTFVGNLKPPTVLIVYDSRSVQRINMLFAYELDFEKKSYTQVFF